MPPTGAGPQALNRLPTELGCSLKAFLLASSRDRTKLDNDMHHRSSCRRRTKSTDDLIWMTRNSTWVSRMRVPSLSHQATIAHWPTNYSSQQSYSNAAWDHLVLLAGSQTPIWSKLFFSQPVTSTTGCFPLLTGENLKVNLQQLGFII